MEVVWNEPRALIALWLLPVLAGLLWLGARRRARAAAAFADAPMRARLFPARTRPRTLLRSALLLAGFAACVLALARPQWGLRVETVTRRGADLFVLLDVSRSMLSTDVAPDRLERAKADVRDLLPRLRGERIGLIAFAGKAVVACPLTTDHAFFRTALAALGPGSAPRGGTAIGDAIRKALAALPPAADRDRALLLITDGEDHESFPREAAALAAEREVRVFAVGLGDPVEGSRVPVTDGSGNRVYLEHEGEQVWSRMHEDLLRTIALETGGAYVPARTRAYDLGETYARHLSGLAGGEGREERRERRPERFQLFLAVGLFAFLLRLAVRPFARGAALLLAGVLLAAPARAEAEPSPHQRLAAAMGHFEQGELAPARRLLERAGEDAPRDPWVALGHGAVLHALGERAEAKARYLVATRGDVPGPAARAFVNLGLLAVDEAREAFGGPPERAVGGAREAGVEAITRAMAHFRAALDRVDDHGPARRNLERLKLWLARVREHWRALDEEREREEDEPPEPSLLDELARLRDDQRALRDGGGGDAAAQRALVARLDGLAPRLEEAAGPGADVAGVRAVMERAERRLAGGDGAGRAQSEAFLRLDGLWNLLAPFEAQVGAALETCRAGLERTEARDAGPYLPEVPRRVALSAGLLARKAHTLRAMAERGGPPPPGVRLLPPEVYEKAIVNAPPVVDLGRAAGDDLANDRFEPAGVKQREMERLLEEIAGLLPPEPSESDRPQDEEQPGEEPEEPEQGEQEQQPGEQEGDARPEPQPQPQPDGGERPGGEAEPGEGPTPEEVEALLRKVEERERAYRERRAEREREAAGAAGVERDW